MVSGKFPPGQFSPGESPLPPVNYHLTKFSLGEFPPGSGLGNLTRWEFSGGQFTRGELDQAIMHGGGKLPGGGGSIIFIGA